MGVLVILVSVIGVAAYYRFKPIQPPSILQLYRLGTGCPSVMVALMFTLPESLRLATFYRLGPPVLLLYPLATILAGKILSDQAANLRSIETIQESEERYRLLFNTSIDAIVLTIPDGRISAANPAACRFSTEARKTLNWSDAMASWMSRIPGWPSPWKNGSGRVNSPANSPSSGKMERSFKVNCPRRCLRIGKGGSAPYGHSRHHRAQEIGSSPSGKVQNNFSGSWILLGRAAAERYRSRKQENM